MSGIESLQSTVAGKTSAGAGSVAALATAAAAWGTVIVIAVLSVVVGAAGVVDLSSAAEAAGAVVEAASAGQCAGLGLAAAAVDSAYAEERAVVAGQNSAAGFADVVVVELAGLAGAAESIPAVVVETVAVAEVVAAAETAPSSGAADTGLAEPALGLVAVDVAEASAACTEVAAVHIAVAAERMPVESELAVAAGIGHSFAGPVSVVGTAGLKAVIAAAGISTVAVTVAELVEPAFRPAADIGVVAAADISVEVEQAVVPEGTVEVAHTGNIAGLVSAKAAAGCIFAAVAERRTAAARSVPSASPRYQTSLLVAGTLESVGTGQPAGLAVV